MPLVNRQQLLTEAQDIENLVHGLLKVFSLRIGIVTRRAFREAHVLDLIAGVQTLLAITEPMLRALCLAASSVGRGRPTSSDAS